MTIEITTSVKEMVDEANAEIETLPVDDAIVVHAADDVVVVDLRDVRELTHDGKIPGCFHMPRGMLEFWVDPQSPYYREEFGAGKKYIFYCAGGMRSALAAQAVQRMGLSPVAHMAGGYKAWTEAGGKTEAKEVRLPKPK